MNKNRRYLALVILVVLLASFFVYRVVYKTEISEFSLYASKSDESGVSADSHFILKTTKSLSAQVLEKYISVSPKIEVDIKKIPDQLNTFEVIPENPLEENKVYTIAFNKGPLASRDFSWAYQIKAPFKVVASIPRDKATYVPVNTGIEMDFNREDIINPDDFFEITPAVSGKFEVAENKVRFIPKHPLKEKTVYTIKIKTGLGAKNTKDVFEKEHIVQFETGENYDNRNTSSVNFSRQFSEIKTGADILLGVRAYNLKSVSVSVYRFNSSSEFIDSVKQSKNTSWSNYYKSVADQFPENKKVFTGDLPIESIDYSNWIHLPETLPSGYYVAVLTHGEATDMGWFQVHPTASFVALAGTESLIWLKDIGSGQNIRNIPILFNGEELTKTGNDGVAVLDTPQDLIRKNNKDYYDNERRFLIAKMPSGDLVIPIESEYGYNTKINPIDTWWDYISLNKNIYLPSDTIRFWTIQKPRQGDASGEEINVILSNSYWDENEIGTIYAETKIKLSEYSTLTGELSFNNLKPGLYDLTFKKGDEIVAKQSVQIKTYIKPAYKIDIVPSRDAVFAGESVTFKVKAEFFDGTDVSNVEMSYLAYSDYKRHEGNFTLNQQGEGFFTLTPEYQSSQIYWPNHFSVRVKPSISEEGQIDASAVVFVFGPHIHNSIDQNQSATNVNFNIKTRYVVLNENLRGKPFWDSEEYLGEVVANASTQISVEEVIYIKEQKGTMYDPINKLTYPVFEYKTEFKPISSSVVTSDQNGVSKFNFPLMEKKTYRFTFITHDDFGRQVKEMRYVSGGLDYIDYDNNDSRYSIYNPDGYNKNYKIGDPINLQLQNGNGILPPESVGNYIFILVNNGDIEYKIQNDAKFKSNFSSKDTPNVGIWPGWFANGRFHNSYLYNASFDANERRLNIEVIKDKSTYKPGETVNLNLRVTDKNKRPVKAEINLSALDQAVFSIKPDEKDVVNDLYRDIYSQIIIRASNVPPYGGGGAEKGGGEGDDSSRSNIQEMAIFRSIETDFGGNASVQFKLPDNITSWRLTTHALSKDLFAGKNVDFIPVSLPFFVDATLNNSYLRGDELVMRLRTFGSEIVNQANFSVESDSLPFKNINKSGANLVEIPLGNLPEGKHKLIIKANGGGFSDSLVRTINVVNSYFVKDESNFYEGINGLKIENDALGYTTLVFSSLGKGRLYNDLKYLSCQCGLRFDQTGAQYVALSLLNKYFGEENEKPEIDISKYQSHDGGIRLLPYSSDDLELSALSANLFSDLVDNKSLKNYLYYSLKNNLTDSSRITMALYGLSAFKEPVLTKIQKIKSDKSLSLKDKVFVALALDTIGAKEEARAYYKESIKPEIEIEKSYAYVGGMKSIDQTILTTTLVATLTASLEEPEFKDLAVYFDQNQPTETLNNFEKLLYIKTLLPKLDAEEVSFDYSAGSKKGSRTLKNGEMFSLVLSPDDLKLFELSSVKGKLGVVVNFEKESSPQSILKDGNLQLRRSYEVDGVPTNQFKEGDMVLVRLNPVFGGNALAGFYQVVDYLPSGLRPVDNEAFKFFDDYDNRIYPIEVDNQKVTFMVGKDYRVPIYYYARVISKGVYKAEPALLQSLNNLNSSTISNEDSVVIK